MKFNSIPSTVQPRLETTTGVWSRSYQQSVFLRPTNSLDALANYFQPNTLGGDHAFKLGMRWRSAHSISTNHWGGNAVARYTNGIPNSVDVYRDGNSMSHRDTWAFFAQDTYTVKRATLSLGFRLDRQSDSAEAATVTASPMAPTQLPAIDFPGLEAGVTWTNFSPRLGFNYDLSGEGRTVAKASYAMYWGTPLAYPSGLVPPDWRTVYGLNPMVGVVEGFRWALLGQTRPEPRMVLVSAAVVCLGLLLSLVYLDPCNGPCRT